MIAQSDRSKRFGKRLWARVRPGDRLRPATLGLALFFALLAAYQLLDQLLDFEPVGVRDTSSVRTAAIVALLAGYSVAALKYARAATAQCVQELRNSGWCSVEQHGAPQRGVLSRYTGRPALPTTIGALVGILIVLFGTDGDPLRGGLPPELLWWTPAVALMFGLLGRGIYWMAGMTRILHRIGENLPTLDLLDMQPLAPFTQYGLQIALLWTVGTWIASLLFLGGGGIVPIASIMVGIGAMATMSLLLPLRGVRRRIRRAKAEELAQVREAIRRERDSLVQSVDPALRKDGATMASLLAYRAFVSSAPDWPIDASTVTRLGLYIAIGFGSWVGAAMVERLLDLVLS